MNLPVPPPATVVEAMRRDPGPRLALLTGGRGSSKTRWCLALLDAARAAGLAVAGVVSPPVYGQGRKVAIDLVDAAGGERRRLADKPPPGERGTAGLGWHFDAETLAWGSALLERRAACDLLLIDELGPLEFRGKGGFRAAFDAVAAQRYRLAIVVIRPELLDQAITRWPWRSHIYDRSVP